jgi:hypothetical protein
VSCSCSKNLSRCIFWFGLFKNCFKTFGSIVFLSHSSSLFLARCCLVTSHRHTLQVKKKFIIYFFFKFCILLWFSCVIRVQKGKKKSFVSCVLCRCKKKKKLKRSNNFSCWLKKKIEEEFDSGLRLVLAIAIWNCGASKRRSLLFFSNAGLH